MRLPALIEGPLRDLDGEVTADQNRTWALWLAAELDRLIDGTGPDPVVNTLVEPDRPTISPDGVLANESTDEARRVLRCLVDSLAKERRGRRGQRPAPS